MFHKSTKTAFVLPPKTGTTTLVNYLLLLDFKILFDKEHPFGNQHAFPTDFLKQYPILNEYRFYGFFRDPLDRFISFLNFISTHPVRRIDYKNYADVINSYRGIPMHNQVNWFDFPNTTVFDFNNLKEELGAIGRLYGSADLKVSKLNASPRCITVTDEIKEFVRHYYDADYQFAKRVLGKEYPT